MDTQAHNVFPTTGTCLSVGAVAGIVVACFVALVLIIVAIILILRQRNGKTFTFSECHFCTLRYFDHLHLLQLIRDSGQLLDNGKKI